VPEGEILVAKFLNTSKAYAEIEDIACKATKNLVFISPYIKLPDTFLVRLKDIDKRNFKITFVCREKDLKAETLNDLKQLNNLELRFLENLHAKCFYNEASMVITSLNLYEFSQQNNREMGILITAKDDIDIFAEARAEAEFIINSANVFKTSRIKDAIEVGDSIIKGVNKFLNQDFGKVFAQNNSEGQGGGFCIRCAKPIAQNAVKPFCRECYDKWAEWKRPDYEESYCHTCGKKAHTAMNKPQCRVCYKNS
jgi:hypothetical protein